MLPITLSAGLWKMVRTVGFEPTKPESKSSGLPLAYVPIVSLRWMLGSSIALCILTLCPTAVKRSSCEICFRLYVGLFIFLSDTLFERYGRVIRYPQTLYQLLHITMDTANCNGNSKDAATHGSDISQTKAVVIFWRNMLNSPTYPLLKAQVWYQIWMLDLHASSSRSGFCSVYPGEYPLCSTWIPFPILTRLHRWRKIATLHQLD